MSYFDIARDTFETLDALGVEHFHLLGHSMGGKAAMVMAIEQPDRVDSLVVADIAPLTYPERHQQIFAGLQAIDLATVTNRTDADHTLANYVDEPGMRQFLLRNLSKTDVGFQWKMHLDYIMDNYQHVIGFPQIQGQFTKPTLFIKGGNSDYITKDHQQKIVSLFPNSKAKIIQGAGHWLHAEKTVIFNRIVNELFGSTQAR